jgi:hypothetical protein
MYHVSKTKHNSIIMRKQQISGVLSSNSFTTLLDFPFNWISQSLNQAQTPLVSGSVKFPVTQGSLYFQHYISVLFCQFLLIFPQV